MATHLRQEVGSHSGTGWVAWQLMDRTVGFPWSLVQSDAEGKTKGIGMSICKGYLKQQGPNVQGTGVRTIKMY